MAEVFRGGRFFAPRSEGCPLKDGFVIAAVEEELFLAVELSRLCAADGGTGGAFADGYFFNCCCFMKF